MKELTPQEEKLLKMAEAGANDKDLLFLDAIDSIVEKLDEIKNKPEKEDNTEASLEQIKVIVGEVISAIKDSQKEVTINNDVTGLVDKTISKIVVENKNDFTPLLKSLEKMHAKMCEEKPEIDYTNILEEIKTSIPQVEQNPLIEDISNTLNDLVAKFEKVVTDTNRIKVEVDRVGEGGGRGFIGGGSGSTSLKRPDGTPINPATEETLQSILAASGGAVYNYILSETGATYKYYGFTSSTGYQVKRKTLATGVWEVATGTYPTPYADFDAAWTARASLTYGYV